MEERPTLEFKFTDERVVESSGFLNDYDDLRFIHAGVIEAEIEVDIENGGRNCDEYYEEFCARKYLDQLLVERNLEEDDYSPRKEVTEEVSYDVLTQRLCEVCREIFDTLVDPSAHYIFQHHSSGKALEISSSSCHVCFSIWKSLSRKGKESIDSRLEGGSQIHFAPFEETSSEAQYSAFGKTIETVTFFLDSEPNIQKRQNEHWGVKRYQVTGSSTRSSPAVGQAVDWLGDCVRHHKLCRRNINPAFWPTRILDLGEPRSPLQIRLVEADAIEKSATYITLSHCWGRTLQQRLLLSNYSDFKTNIPLESLSKTYQDSIYVAKLLLQRYLWIDSLCIIQDSPEDWRRESEMMGKVYGHSFLNIAATAAANGTEGMFRDRDVRSFGPCEVWIPGIQSVCHFNALHDNWWEEFEREPLNQRAWVVQERFLSPRVLHFGSTQLIWECDQLTACEEYPLRIPDEYTTACRTTSEAKFRKSLLTSSKPLSEHWTEVVRFYSRCSLTRDSDKLIALAGIRARFQEILGDTCIAGIWARQMEQHLCWNVRHPRPDRPAYSAPSWSWVSTYGEINYYYPWGTGGFSAKVLNLREVITRMNEVGEVHDSRLRLQCYLCPGFLKRVKGSYKIVLGLDADQATLSAYTAPDLRNILDDNSSIPAWFLPIGCFAYIYGLILQQCDPLKTEFRRLGYWSTRDIDGSNNIDICMSYFSRYWKVKEGPRELPGPEDELKNITPEEGVQVEICARSYQREITLV